MLHAVLTDDVPKWHELFRLRNGDPTNSLRSSNWIFIRNLRKLRSPPLPLLFFFLPMTDFQKYGHKVVWDVNVFSTWLNNKRYASRLQSSTKLMIISLLDVILSQLYPSASHKTCVRNSNFNLTLPSLFPCSKWRCSVRSSGPIKVFGPS